MRKILFILFALVMFQFACEQPGDPAPYPGRQIDYDQVSDGFQEMFEGAFSMTESLELVSVVERTRKQLTIRVEAGKISEAAKDHFSGYLGSFQAPHQKYDYPARPFSPNLNLEKELGTLNNLIDTAQVFNEVQKMYIKSLSGEIMAVESVAEGYKVVAMFRDKVLNANNLGENDKVILLEIAAGSGTLLDFFKNGGVQMVRNNLSDKLGGALSFGRTTGCHVDWRGAWMDGVIGLTVGAAFGFYAGATGGTIVMPIVGSVTGAVNGAVIGGAIGFTSGVLQGIASDLFLSCSRNTTPRLAQSFASCELAWEAYYNNRTSKIPSDCFNVRITL